MVRSRALARRLEPWASRPSFETRAQESALLRMRSGFEVASGVTTFARWSCGFRHAPEERQRTLDDARDVLAPGRVAQEEAGRRVDHVLQRRLVETAHRGLLLVEILGLEPGGDFLFRAGAIRPAKPRLVA